MNRSVQDDSFPHDDPFAHDPFVHDDAAYLLGALPPDERAAFEAHMEGCGSCARSVAELSGLPGLLGTVSPEVVAALEAVPRADDPPPPGLAADVLSRVRRAERWRRRRRLALSVAAAAALLLVVVVVAPIPGRTPESPAPGVRVVALDTVGDGPLSVTARLTPVAWGTRIELRCSYRESVPSPYATPPSYSLVLRADDGDLETAGSWLAVPGREVVVQAATALTAGHITELEVRDPAGAPVLRAPVG